MTASPPGAAIGLVTLDFWQTLFADTPDGLRRAHALRLDGVRETLAEAGRPYAAAEVDAADGRAAEVFNAVWREHRDLTPAEQIRTFLETLDPVLPGALDPGTLDRVARAYQEPALTHRPEITPGAAMAVRELRARGLRLGVISNTGRTPGRVLRQLLEAADLLPHFTVLAFSDERGVRKPATAMFRWVLAEAGTEADRVVHVGDDALTDVAGAQGAGMRAIHFVPDASRPAAAADAVLRGFADLPALVARLGRPTGPDRATAGRAGSNPTSPRVT
jgi:putative hydrolase of the HAD superfamily